MCQPSPFSSNKQRDISTKKSTPSKEQEKLMTKKDKKKKKQSNVICKGNQSTHKPQNHPLEHHNDHYVDKDNGLDSVVSEERKLKTNQKKNKKKSGIPKECLIDFSSGHEKYFWSIKKKSIIFPKLTQSNSNTPSCGIIECYKEFDFLNDYSNYDVEDGTIESIRYLWDQKVAVMKKYITEIWDMNTCSIERVIRKNFDENCGDYLLRMTKNGWSVWNWRSGKFCHDILYPNDSFFYGLCFGSSPVIHPNNAGRFEMWDPNRSSKKLVQKIPCVNTDYMYGKGVSSAYGGSCVFTVMNSLVVISFDEQGMMKIQKEYKDVTYGRGNSIDPKRYACQILDDDNTNSGLLKISVIDIELGHHVNQYSILLDSFSNIYRISSNCLFVIGNSAQNGYNPVNVLVEIETGRVFYLNTNFKEIYPIGNGCFISIEGTVLYFHQFNSLFLEEEVEEMKRLHGSLLKASFCDVDFYF